MRKLENDTQLKLNKVKQCINQWLSRKQLVI